MTCLILAFAYSLTQSCKLCNVNPYDYRENLLTNPCDHTRTIDSFIPHLWKRQSKTILKIYKTTFSPEKVILQTACTLGSDCIATQISDTYKSFVICKN